MGWGESRAGQGALVKGTSAAPSLPWQSSPLLDAHLCIAFRLCMVLNSPYLQQAAALALPLASAIPRLGPAALAVTCSYQAKAVRAALTAQALWKQQLPFPESQH